MSRPVWQRERTWHGCSLERIQDALGGLSERRLPKDVHSFLSTPEWQGSRVSFPEEGWVLLEHPSGSTARLTLDAALWAYHSATDKQREKMEHPRQPMRIAYMHGKKP